MNPHKLAEIIRDEIIRLEMEERRILSDEEISRLTERLLLKLSEEKK